MNDKKLRRRFIIVNMSILTCVLFGVLTGIFAYMYSSEVRISYELIESILNEKDINFNKPDKIMESAENETVTENGGFLAQMSYISQNNNQKNEAEISIGTETSSIRRSRKIRLFLIRILRRSLIPRPLKSRIIRILIKKILIHRKMILKMMRKIMNQKTMIAAAGQIML